MRVRRAALWLLVVLFVPAAAHPQAAPIVVAPAAKPAEIGIQLTAVGGANWLTGVRKRFFTPDVMNDIRDNLHASFVRIGWFPNDLHRERIPWRREDQALDTICGAGLRVLFLIPSPKDDPKGTTDDLHATGAFLDRYTHREFGCIEYAEVGNESDLSVNGFSSVDQYATFYEAMAPIVASYGVKVITTGTSGEDVPWTQRLAALLRSGNPAPQLDGFGFHPYGVEPSQMAAATVAVRQAGAAFGTTPFPEVYVTEIGEHRPDDLYRAIVALAPVTPIITIYEYLPRPNEDAGYAIKTNPQLYDAVVRAWTTLHAQASRSEVNGSVAVRR
jgi:hypothetical protein